MMITFSISRSITSLSIAWRSLGAPPGDRAAQLQRADPTGKRGEPEREAAVGQYGDDRQLHWHSEGREGADHAAINAPDPAGKRQRVAQHPQEVRHHNYGGRRRASEGVKAGPQDR